MFLYYYYFYSAIYLFICLFAHYFSFLQSQESYIYMYLLSLSSKIFRNEHNSLHNTTYYIIKEVHSSWMHFDFKHGRANVISILSFTLSWYQ